MDNIIPIDPQKVRGVASAAVRLLRHVNDAYGTDDASVIYQNSQKHLLAQFMLK